MAYYEDLTAYNYHHYCEKEMNVGWLKKGQPFTIGKYPDGLTDKLKMYGENHAVFQTKGFHCCEFCGDSYGSNELRVISCEGVVYACPGMIIHYIENHDYLPPQEFIDAVLSGPEPGSEEYNNIVKRLPESWERRKPDPNDEGYENKMREVMIEKLSQEVDQSIIDDVLNDNPNFQKFVEAYNKIMPAVYSTGLNNNKKS